MIPLDVALDPDVSLDTLAASTRRGLAAAEAALRQAAAHERALADLPPAAVLPATPRLLADARRLATERVALYRRTLVTLEQARAAR